MEFAGVAAQIQAPTMAARRVREWSLLSSRFHPRADAVQRDFIAADGRSEWLSVLQRQYAENGPGAWPVAADATPVS